MIKIAHIVEAETLSHLPLEVVSLVIEIATILDDNYGNTRDVNHDLGGYILIAEVAEDVKAIKKLIDLDYTLPEYVDLIACESGEKYTNSLIILSNDYSISLLIPLNITPKEMLKYMEE